MKRFLVVLMLLVAVPVQAGIVAWYDFETGTANDLSANNLDGEVIGAEFRTDGLFFNEQDRVVVQDSQFFNLQVFAVEAEFRPDAMGFGPSGLHRILVLRDPPVSSCRGIAVR